MVSQVLVLRELLVLAQGQELKLALGLWCWLLWTGLGSLLGGWLVSRRRITAAHLSGLLGLLGLLLPATMLVCRSLPTLAHLPWGQSLPLGAAFLISLLLLAPLGLVSGYFFPCACRALAGPAPAETPGRVYYLETLGAALGVLILQIFLLGRFSSLGLSLAAGMLLALSPWLLARPRSLKARGLAAAALLALAATWGFTPQLEHLSRGWQWPGRQVIATADSPYALLYATREAEQVSFFANNLWQFTDPDPFTAEYQVHLGLLEHPDPRRVLLLGGGVAGLGAEVLKSPGVTNLDYVELDPQLVRLAQDLLPAAAGLARDPRVTIIYQDARLYLETTGRRYDVILMALPEPRSAQLNRFYTREFFRTAARRLAPQGVFSFALTGGETSLHPLRAAYLAMAYHTLGRVFPEILAFPGERVRFLASVNPGTLTAAPESLVRRLHERRLSLRYVREYYLLNDLAPDRLAYLRKVLSQPPPELNTDLAPGCYFYDLLLSSVQEGLALKEVLLRLRGLPTYVPWAALGLGLALLGLGSRRRPEALFLLQVVIMGLGTMTLEIVLLILYQVQLGSLYRQLGMLIAAFMVGMAAGAAAGSRLAERRRAGAGLLAGAQGGLALLALVLALGLRHGFPGLLAPWEYLSKAGYALALALAGGGGGAIFALSAALWARNQPEARAQGGILYAADLLGATLGTLGASLLIIPVWGILAALYGAAVLHAGAALLVLASRR